MSSIEPRLGPLDQAMRRMSLSGGQRGSGAFRAPPIIRIPSMPRIGETLHTDRDATD